MQRSTTSPSTTTKSTDIDCIASQHNTIKKTSAQTYTLNCGRFGCPVIFIYGAGTDWPTVSSHISDHSLVCRGGFYTLSHSPPRADTHDTQQAPSPPPPTPEGLGAKNSNRDNKVSSGSCKRRRKEDKRKQELEEDEYTADVQPISVKCRGCQKAIKLDKRSRYYPGLWVKHRGKCPGIRKIEEKMGFRRIQNGAHQPPPHLERVVKIWKKSRTTTRTRTNLKRLDLAVSPTVLDGKFYNSPRTLASNVQFFRDYCERVERRRAYRYATKNCILNIVMSNVPSLFCKI
ncbi:hypothetical protein CY34DRAFT_539875 [Suillus luteus UH-Slu-Lm8-n1]|uniref:Uncharacterized protein n=1 Tax=Suillus luteus UH-Slu-Lm8-n1 TaxID=930992 RepID=A0A0D0A5C0_9AGAM|nr:hypothetical protein CY34DRAFT_539875 [Suillus luteus UH-Slu-Lm8-n1]